MIRHLVVAVDSCHHFYNARTNVSSFSSKVRTMFEFLFLKLPIIRIKSVKYNFYTPYMGLYTPQYVRTHDKYFQYRFIYWREKIGIQSCFYMFNIYLDLLTDKNTPSFILRRWNQKSSQVRASIRFALSRNQIRRWMLRLDVWTSNCAGNCRKMFTFW